MSNGWRLHGPCTSSAFPSRHGGGDSGRNEEAGDGGYVADDEGLYGVDAGEDDADVCFDGGGDPDCGAVVFDKGSVLDHVL